MKKSRVASNRNRNFLLSYKKFSRKKSGILTIAMALVGISSLFVSFAAEQYNLVVQAEKLKYDKAVIVNDNKNQVAELKWNTNGTGSFTLKESVTKLDILAKASQCDGAPMLNILVDDKPVLNQAIASASYKVYSAKVSLDKGVHNLSVSFRNDLHKPGVCDRNISLDSFKFIGKSLFTSPKPPVSACAVGINVIESGGNTDAERSKTIELIKQTDASWVRINIVWPQIQPKSKNDYDKKALMRYDDFVNKLRASGINILATQSDVPEWAKDPNAKYAPRAEAYAEYMKFLSSHFKGRISAYQVLNEVNSSWPADTGPVSYAKILKASYPKIKKEDPKAKVYYAGLAYSHQSAPAFLQATYEQGAKDSFDVLGMHFYPQPSHDHNQYIDSIRQVMVNNGDVDKKISVTETGSTTARDARGNPVTGAVNEAEQVATAKRNYASLLSHDFILKNVFYYELIDHDRRDYKQLQNDSEKEYRFGAFKTNYTPKPVVGAFKEIQVCPAPKPQKPAIIKKPLYQLWNATKSDHLYTTDDNEKKNISSQSIREDERYEFQGIAGYVSSQHIAGSTPLYRLYSTNSTDHFYTIDEGQRAGAKASFRNYVDQGIIGYVLTAQSPDTTPLYQLWSNTYPDHFYTIDEGQRAGAKASFRNYVDQGNAGFVYKN